MCSLRKKLHVAAFVLIATFSFAALEWHADHDANAKTPAANHCCVQCCPSHHLVPPSTPQISSNVPPAVASFIEFTDSFQQGLILNKIYRPPIA